MMERKRHSDLLEEIEEARQAEDLAWAMAAEARRRQVSNEELIGALQLMEATTIRRLNLEQELKYFTFRG